MAVPILPYSDTKQFCQPFAQVLLIDVKQGKVPFTGINMCQPRSTRQGFTLLNKCQRQHTSKDQYAKIAPVSYLETNLIGNIDIKQMHFTMS